MDIKTPVRWGRDWDDLWIEDADGNIIGDDEVIALINAGARLPRTKDGVIYIPGSDTPIFHPDGAYCAYPVTERADGTWRCNCPREFAVSDCFSTPEASEAARRA